MQTSVVGRQSHALSLVAGASIACWVSVLVLVSGRGLDLTDEGFYLLSYRWWDTNPYTFTAAQYLVGPLYEAMGYDVQALRLGRGCLILAAHSSLGISAAAWIRDTRSADSNETHRAAVVLAVTAAGGLILAAGPLSPGYNDVVLMSTVLLAAAALSIHRNALLGRALPMSVALWLGPVVVAMSMAKWASAVLTVLMVAGATAIACRSHATGGFARFLALFAVSSLTSVTIVHLVVMPLTTVVPPMVSITERLGSGSNAPTALLWHYVISTSQILVLCLVPVALTVVVLVGARSASRKVQLLVASAAPLMALAAVVGFGGGLTGGMAGTAGYITALVAASVAAWFAILILGEKSGSATPGTRPMLILLLALPGVQAFGTGNSLPYLAANGFAMWTVVMLRTWATGSEVRRNTAAVAVAGTTAVIGWVAATGMLAGPYRTPATSEDLVPVSSRATGTLSLDRASAQAVNELRRRVPPSVPIMAFDEMAGLVLLLDGYPVGEAWYSALDPERTATGIAAYCHENRDPWGDGRPYILANRSLTDVDLDALAECGLSLADYGRQSHPGLPATGELDLYVPQESP